MFTLLIWIPTLKKSQPTMVEKIPMEMLERIGQLVTGLIALLNGKDFVELAKAFNMDEKLLKGVLALVKGDLDGAVGARFRR